MVPPDIKWLYSGPLLFLSYTLCVPQTLGLLNNRHSIYVLKMIAIVHMEQRPLAVPYRNIAISSTNKKVNKHSKRPRRALNW
jgi:hypothetical protein